MSIDASPRPVSTPRFRARPATNALEIALVVTTYQKPWHLERALASIAMQEGVSGKFEVVVADDGSTDSTPQLVEDFARTVDFPVQFTTHPHEAFCVAKSRNEGAAATRAPYLLFLDGDCILPPDHVYQHLRRRRPGTAYTGYCYRLSREDSRQISVESVYRHDFLNMRLPAQWWKLKIRDWKSRFYTALGHSTKPRLTGGNTALWRTDFEAVNGYDQNFRGWGSEDDDLGVRLFRNGTKIASILRWTRTYHLWHPTETSAPSSCWRENMNTEYFEKSGRLACCRNGMNPRDWTDLEVQLVGQPARHVLVDPLLKYLMPRPPQRATPEVEVLVSPGEGSFSGRADCNVLLVLEDTPAVRAAMRKAHVIISDCNLHAGNRRVYRLAEIDQAMETIV